VADAHCLVCGDEMSLPGSPPVEGADRAVVFCAGCGTPHHEDCFSYSGSCSVYACGSLRYSRRGRKGREVKKLKTGGKRPRQPERPVEERQILDLYTPLENTLWMLAMFSLATTLAILMSQIEGKRPRPHVDPEWALIPAALSAFFGLLYNTTSCYYVADGATRQLLFHTEFLGVTWLYPIAKFDQLVRIELTAYRRWQSGTKHRSGRFYTDWRLEAVERGGDRHVVADPSSSDGGDAPAQLAQAGGELARLAGCKFGRRRVPFDRFGEGLALPLVGMGGAAVVGALVAGMDGALMCLLVVGAILVPTLAGVFFGDDGRD
jgi:hypothetical protein